MPEFVGVIFTVEATPIRPAGQDHQGSWRGRAARVPLPLRPQAPEGSEKGH